MPKKTIPVEFKIVDIDTIQFSYDSKIDLNNIDEFDTISGIGFAVILNDQIVISKFNFELKDRDLSLLKIESEIYFQFSKKSFDNFNNKNSIVIPKNIAEHLASITVSTTRGILVEKTKKTNFEYIYLPLINVRKMIDGDIIFNQSDFEEE